MAMRGEGLNKKFTFKKDVILEKLRKNRETHSAIVKEAKDGWAAAAEKMILGELEKVRTSRIPTHLSFHLSPPEDHTDVYDTFIMQLEMAEETELQLDGDQFRKLLQDKWDWTDMFLANSSAYSDTARKLSEGA